MTLLDQWNSAGASGVAPAPAVSAPSSGAGDQGNGVLNVTIIGNQDSPPPKAAPKFDPSQSYGTPAKLLDNLQQTESSGDAHAVNPKTGAMGAYQFLPSTVAMLNKQGVKFDPFDPTQARAAADYYLQHLAQANGGDMTKAVAQYGGFNQQDPTAYVNKVLNGVQPPAEQAATQASHSLLDQWNSASAPPRAPQPPVAGAPAASGAPATSVESPPPGIIASAAAGAGSGFGRSMLGLEQRIGEIASVGDNPIGAPIGNALKQDAIVNDQALQDQNAPYQAAHPYANIGGQVVGMIANPISDLVPESAIANPILRSTINGGLFNALTTVNHNQGATPLQSAGDVLANAAWGGVGGAAGAAIGAGIGRIVSPKAASDPLLQVLRESGVNPTVGQSIGGWANKLEQQATSLPIVGSAISAARSRATGEFNLATINKALEPIGATVDKIGSDGVAQAGDKLSAAYNDVLEQIQGVTYDQKFTQDLAQLSQYAKSLTPDMAARFQKVIKNEFTHRLSPVDGMDAVTLKTAVSKIGKIASNYSGSGDASQRELGGALTQLKSMIDDQIERSYPDLAPKLKAIDQGWATLVRVEGAAKKAANSDGVFTPGQLLQSIREADGSVRKRAISRGQGMMQDWAQAGQRVLGNTVPDSGTAGRAMWGATGYLAAGHPLMIPGMGIGSAMYSRPVQNILNAVTTKRPGFAIPIADLINRASPRVAAASAGIPQTYYNRSANGR